jgi:hypothetical protein
MSLGEEMALPYEFKDYQPAFGLTIRQYYAGLAMQGYLAARWSGRYKHEDLATEAVKQADALIAELEKSDENNS